MAKKKTVDECIALSKELHGDAFDYSLFLVEGYTNNKKPVSLICKEHSHTFKVTMNDHLGKKLSGCPLCGLSKRTGRTAKRTFDQVVEEGSSVHDNKYTYLDTLPKYISSSNISIVCPVHGTFVKNLSDHLNKAQGCQTCAKAYSDAELKSFEDAVQEASAYFNNKYDYSSVDVTKLSNLDSKVSIICNVHGEFKQSFRSHFFDKRGCNRCAHALDKEDVLKVINSSIDTSQYSLAEIVVPETTLVKDLVIKNIFCIKHSQYFDKSYTSLQDNGNKGCSLCKNESLSSILLSTKEEFISKASLCHGDTFDYSEVEYKSSLIPVKIRCKKHGSFFQRPDSHLTSKICCPSCVTKVSSPELDILSFIKSKYEGIVEQSYRPSWLNRKELDIYIPELKLGIEFNGSFFHHSSKSQYVSSYASLMAKSPSYHFDKWKSCYDNNVTLLSIYDFYWNDPVKRRIYLSKIQHYLGLDERVFARKTKLVEISNKDAYEFYDSNHIEGSGFTYKNSRSFGLLFNGNLIMAATVGDIYIQSSKSWKTKLHRICTLNGHTVVGGISKLFKYIQNEFGNVTYQITLSSGGTTLRSASSYTIISPRYFWVDPTTLSYYHRNSCQKSKLEKTFGQQLLENDTENTYMERLGYLKVFDNGLAEIKLS